MSNLSLNQLRPQQVCERLGCGKTQLYELVKAILRSRNRFNYQKRCFWYECEIDAWTIKKAAEQQGISIEAMTERLANASAFSHEIQRIDGKLKMKIKVSNPKTLLALTAVSALLSCAGFKVLADTTDYSQIPVCRRSN